MIDFNGKRGVPEDEEEKADKDLTREKAPNGDVAAWFEKWHQEGNENTKNAKNKKIKAIQQRVKQLKKLQRQHQQQQKHLQQQFYQQLQEQHQQQEGGWLPWLQKERSVSKKGYNNKIEEEEEEEEDEGKAKKGYNDLYRVCMERHCGRAVSNLSVLKCAIHNLCA